MNVNLLNVEEIFSIPGATRGNKLSFGRSGTHSGYSRMTDPMFLAGCRVRHSHSQDTYQEMSQPSITALAFQHGSQEVSEPKGSAKYQTRPYNFGVDKWEKPIESQLGCGKAKGILGLFEESKKKAKEKDESELFNNRFSQLEESVDHIKISLNRIESQADSRKTFIAEGLDVCSKQLEDKVRSMCDPVLSELKSQSQVLAEMEKMETEMKSCMLALQDNIERMKMEHSKDNGKISEKLDLLNSSLKFDELVSFLTNLASSYRPTCNVKDCTVQTSPRLCENFCLVSEEKTYFESTRVCKTNTLQPSTALMPEELGNGTSTSEKESDEQCAKVSGTINEQAIFFLDEDRSMNTLKNRVDENPSLSSYYMHSTGAISGLSEPDNGLQTYFMKENEQHERKGHVQSSHISDTQNENNLYGLNGLTQTSNTFKGEEVVNGLSKESNAKDVRDPKKDWKRKKGFRKGFKKFPSRKKQKVKISVLSQSKTESMLHPCEDRQGFRNETQMQRDPFETEVENVRMSAEKHQYQTAKLQKKKNKIIPVSYSCESVGKTSQGSCRMGPTKVDLNLWDYFQDSSCTQHITGYEKKTLSWVSPFSPLVHKNTFPIVSIPKKQEMQESKVVSYLCVFDSSDDSD
ncbi:interactor of HORMAD1 protein 1 isoform X1 [Lepisosteus oculatus]|uniref:interactor of HORMAD1 protein 1 isoform X1 n=1 Tax=Lepisosteus oculatus TaxID=7918 RepID=UPI0037184375